MIDLKHPYSRSLQATPAAHSFSPVPESKPRPLGRTALRPEAGLGNSVMEVIGKTVAPQIVCRRPTLDEGTKN